MNQRELRSHPVITSHKLGLVPARSLAVLLLAACAIGSLSGCARSATHASSPQARLSGEQALVEKSAAAFSRLREDQRFAAMATQLQRARAVMIFPRVVKASLIVGGEGGSGVLVAKQADGSWSGPAFYSVGSPSLGLQAGYQQATVVLFIMDQPTLERVLHSSLMLGGNAGATLGKVDEIDGNNSDVLSANIYQVIDAEGAFAGLSLDGYVIGARPQHNRNYYGKPVTPGQILLDGSAANPGSAVLTNALQPKT
jgi:lipid-binding SYLF domain-containing protein